MMNQIGTPEMLCWQSGREIQRCGEWRHFSRMTAWSSKRPHDYVGRGEGGEVGAGKPYRDTQIDNFCDKYL